MPAHRMHRGLVALSASAVAAVYLAGYVRTQAADASIGATSVTPASTPVAAAAPEATSAPSLQQSPPLQVPGSRRGVPTAQPTSAPATISRQPQTQAPSGASQTQAAYKDGTYTGQGTSRRGDVWVSVQVSAGRIANVTITRSTLQYPLRDIANLPSEVVQRQSAQVDSVSRATYSSMAFRGAVTQALASAQTG